MNKFLKTPLFMCLGATMMLSCGPQEEIQPGPRYALDGQYVGGEQSQGVNVPALLGQVTTRDWQQHLSDASHTLPNAQLSTTPRLVARVDLNAKVRKAAFGASAPIIVGNVIYHYDAAGRLHAINSAGQNIWTISLVPAGETVGDGFGGGLAYSGGVIFAATGYGEVVAVSAQNGGVIWRYKQASPFRKAPLVLGNKVIVTSKGTQAIALDTARGTPVWRSYSAQATVPSRINAGVPAGSGSNVVLSYASGELQNVNAQNGLPNWDISSLSDLFGGSKSVFGDVVGDPVFAGGKIIVGTQSGVAAISQNSGQKLWSNNIGTKGPMIVSGNSVFGITMDERLFRLSAENGQILWTKQLPKKVSDNIPFSPKISYFDPRLVNGEIWVMNSRGELKRFHAQTGQLLQTSEIPKLANTPVFGSGLMVAISQKGQLLIFR